MNGVVEGGIDKVGFEIMEIKRRKRAFGFLLLKQILLLFLINEVCLAKDAVPSFGHTRSIAATQITTVLTIDGELTEAQWTEASIADNFWLVAEQRSVTDQTEAMVLYDHEFLYFGFRCYESRPESIYSIKTRRDSGLENDDRVSVQLDPFHDHRGVSTYSVNANGTQNDDIASGRARKIEWKGDWKSAVARTEYGWSVEMQIPFRILNYHSDVQVIGINFYRYQNHSDEWSYWANITPQYKSQEMGHLIGVTPPSFISEQRWTVMPYSLLGTNVPNIKGETRDELLSFGGDIRYSPKPNFTNVFSLHPDFSQVESQVTNIDFSYTEKFRSDPRPFFQEGSIYFGRENNYFYSNRVPDFYAGAKSFGKWRSSERSNNQTSQLTTGALATRSPDNRWDSAFRLNWERDAFRDTSVLLVSTDRKELDNQLIVGQINKRNTNGLYFDADIARSNTRKEDSEGGNGFRGSVGWQTNYWTIGTSGDYYDKEYFPANALFAQDRYGTKNVNTSVDYYRDLNVGAIRALTGGLSLSRRDTLEGLLQNHNLYASVGIELSQQVRIDAEYFGGEYRPLEGDRGEFSDVVNQDRFWGIDLNFNTRNSLFGYGVYYANGVLAGDDYEYVSGYVLGKPTYNSAIKLSSEKLNNFGSFRQTVLSGSWEITQQDSLISRVIWSDGDTSLRIAYRRAVRFGMDVFAVYDDEPGSRQQYSIKTVWTLP